MVHFTLRAPAPLLAYLRNVQDRAGLPFFRFTGTSFRTHFENPRFRPSSPFVYTILWQTILIFYFPFQAFFLFPFVLVYANFFSFVRQISAGSLADFGRRNDKQSRPIATSYSTR